MQCKKKVEKLLKEGRDTHELDGDRPKTFGKK